MRDSKYLYMNGKRVVSVARRYSDIETLLKGQGDKKMANFVQLDGSDCAYLLELIGSMDSGTQYTAKQRTFTIPKLQRISQDPSKTRLAFQDVEYLLDLIEDDELPESEQQRTETQLKLEDILDKQKEAFEAARSIEDQRSARRALRNPSGALQGHFQRTSTVLKGR